MAYSNAALAVAPARPFIVVQRAQMPTFNKALFERFIDYTDRKDTTVKGYVTCIRQFVKWLDLNGITQPERENIKAYRDYLSGSDLATGTQAQYLRAVKHFFKWTAAEGLYPNIADNIHGAEVKRDIHRKDAFEVADVLSIADTIDRSTEQGKRFYAMFLLNFVNGLRVIEIHRANVGDIKTIKGEQYLYIQGKGHDEKDTPKYLEPNVYQAIQEYLESRSAKALPKSPLFTSTSNRSKGGRIATTTISTMFKECFVKAGYDSDRLTAHSGRHTAAETALYNGGANLFETQQLMGHKDPATTEIYVTKKNQLDVEKKYRTAIYNAYFKGTELTQIIPELEAEIMTMTAEEQAALLAQIRAQRGGKV